MQPVINKIHNLCLNGDFKQAFLLCLECGEHDCTTCQRRLGWMYYLGIGVDQDESEGLKWMEKAAQSKSSKSLFGLGRLLEDLNEYGLAKQVYRESADKGYLPSEFRLAQMIRYGIECDIDKKLALSILNAAGKKGHLPSQAARATLLRKGEAGLWGIIVGLLQTIYISMKFVWYGIFSPQSEKLLFSFPLEFNIEMMKRKRINQIRKDAFPI